MLQRLTNLLSQLHGAGLKPQISLIPGEDGGMAVIAAWQQGDDLHEVAQHYTAAEAQAATDEALYASVEMLAAEVWCAVSEARGEDMTPEKAMDRLRQAAAQSPKNQAVDRLALIVPGVQ